MAKNIVEILLCLGYEKILVHKVGTPGLILFLNKFNREFNK